MISHQQSQVQLTRSLLSKKEEELGHGTETIKKMESLVSSLKDELSESEALMTLKNQVKTSYTCRLIVLLLLGTACFFGFIMCTVF